MTKKLLLVLSAAALPLGACSSMDNDRTLATAGTGAVVGGAAGAGIAAATGGDILTGALIGGAVGGVAGAFWADRNNDGRADGYYQNGTYYPGVPSNYNAAAYNGQPVAARNCPSVAGSALTGAAVGGLAGAVWADANNDGCVDGYTREGRYYPGAPVVQPVPATYRAGERG